MNAKQTKLIEQAATVDVDGEGWRKRMDAWLDEKHGQKYGWMDRVFIEALLAKP